MEKWKWRMEWKLFIWMVCKSTQCNNEILDENIYPKINWQFPNFSSFIFFLIIISYRILEKGIRTALQRSFEQTFKGV